MIDFIFGFIVGFSAMFVLAAALTKRPMEELTRLQKKQSKEDFEEASQKNREEALAEGSYEEFERDMKICKQAHGDDWFPKSMDGDDK